MSQAATYSLLRPPEEVLSGLPPQFAPAPDLSAWVQATFITDGSPLHNHDHDHLQEADIGFLWTNASNRKRGRVVLGEARKGEPDSSKGKWIAARQEAQLREWFGEVPDFLVTLYAPWVADADAVSACALIEHELYHCAQVRDEFGSPRFSQTTGLPIWAIRGHDVEEFVGVVRRYGAWSSDVLAMVKAANRGATLDAAKVVGVCGCGSRIS